MKPVPDEVLGRFFEVLKKRSVAESIRQDYVKWLRYFLDYGDRYSLPATRSDVRTTMIYGERGEERTRLLSYMKVF